MLDDPAVTHGVPVNVLHFEVPVGWRSAHQHAAVDRDSAHTFMSAAHFATDRHGIAGGHEVDDLHPPVRKGPVDVLQHFFDAGAADRPAVVAGILGIECRGALPVTPVQ